MLFVMIFIVSACTVKDTDRETEQLTEDTSTSFESDTAMPIEDDAEETENQETEMIDMGIFDEDEIIGCGAISERYSGKNGSNHFCHFCFYEAGIKIEP